MAKRRGRSRRGSYKFTARRRTQLKQAQLISARKRKAAPNKNSSGRKFNTAAMGGKKRKSSLGAKVALTTVGVGALTTAAVVARHKLSGSGLSYGTGPLKNTPISVIPQINVHGSDKTIAGAAKIAGYRPTGKTGLTFNRDANGGFGISYTTNKGYTSKTLAYSHHPLKLSSLVAGKRTKAKTTGPADSSIDGGIKYRGGVVVPHIMEFVKGKPVSIESKEIPSLAKGTFSPKREHAGKPQRKENVGTGESVEEFLLRMREKYPKTARA